MPSRAHLVERRAQLVDGRADAGEVRHRLEPVLVADARDDLERLAARRAAGAVGDRHEGGLERPQLARSPRRGCASPSGVFGGKNSNEKTGSVAGAEDLVDAHVADLAQP